MESCNVCKKLNETKIDQFYSIKDLPTVKGWTNLEFQEFFWKKISCLREIDFVSESYLGRDSILQK